jgi:hypothetical protein
MNLKAMLQSVMGEIHGLVEGTALHTMLMFDELATEKRIHWDPKTNYFLGVCQQHAHRTLMEFINEGDLEELFQHLNSDIDEEKVHYGGEVGFGSIWKFASGSSHQSILGHDQHTWHSLQGQSHVSRLICSCFW